MSALKNTNLVLEVENDNGNQNEINFKQRPKIYPKRTKTLSTKRTLIVAHYNEAI
jgi:hypothetical protein